MRRVRQLTPRTLFRLVETAAGYAVAQVGFALPPGALLGGWVQHALRAPAGARDDIDEAMHLARVSEAVGRRWPLRTRCLQRSLVLRWLLGRRGIESRLRVGVLKTDGAMTAHAWVEVAGEPVNDTRDHCAVFLPLEASDERMVALAELEGVS